MRRPQPDDVPRREEQTGPTLLETPVTPSRAGLRPGLRILARRLSQLAFGSLLANALSVLSVLLLAKRMGPEAFGQYYLVVSLANLAVLPVAAGIGAALIRELAMDGRPAESLGAAATALVAFVGLLTAAWLVPGVPAAVLGTAGQTMRGWAYVFAVGSALAMVFESYFRGRREIGRLSALKVVASLVNVGVALVLLSRGEVAAASPLIARLAEMSVLVVSIALLSDLRLAADPSRLRPFYRYAAPAVASTVGMAVFANIDKLFLNRLLTPAELGRYSLAFYLTYILVSKAADIAHGVLFSEMVAVKDKRQVAIGVRRIWPPLFAVLWVGLLGASLALGLYVESAFALNWWHFVWFSLGGTLYFMAQLFWWLISAGGPRHARAFGAAAAVSCAVTITVTLSLVPTHREAGAIAGLLGGTSVLFLLGWIALHRICGGAQE